MSSGKKIESVLNLIEIAENNLRTARNVLNQLVGYDKTTKIPSASAVNVSLSKSNDEEKALEVVEGYFNGEAMLGDNGQVYVVPPNYASKTQLVIGDRMKWILTPEREVFKLIQPAARERITGTFAIEGDSYFVLADNYPNPIKLLKASATFAMKNLGLNTGDEVAVFIPKDSTPNWGAFSSVVKTQNGTPIQENTPPLPHTNTDLDGLHEFKIDSIDMPDANDYF